MLFKEKTINILIKTLWLLAKFHVKIYQYVYVDVHIYTCIYTCIYINTYVYIYIYIYICNHENNALSWLTPQWLYMI